MPEGEISAVGGTSSSSSRTSTSNSTITNDNIDIDGNALALIQLAKSGGNEQLRVNKIGVGEDMIVGGGDSGGGDVLNDTSNKRKGVGLVDCGVDKMSKTKKRKGSGNSGNDSNYRPLQGGQESILQKEALQACPHVPCNYKCETNADMKKHRAHKHNVDVKWVYCPYGKEVGVKEQLAGCINPCKYKCKTKSDLKKHLKSIHTPESEIVYYYCGLVDPVSGVGKCPYKTKFKSLVKRHELGGSHVKKDKGKRTDREI